MSERFDLRREWLFAGFLISFCVIYALWYPATISILDESSIIAIAYSIEHGSIFTENAGRQWGLKIGDHMVEKQSPFHAALLSPVMAVNWHLIFIVSAGFFVVGAFVFRSMLSREGLGSGWTALYFLLPGGLYYSQTVMAAVPASVMALLGISLCLRSEPRPLLGGLAFGVSVLLHPWMGPFAIVFCGVWILERRFDGTLELMLGALPSILLVAAYNFLTTGNPFRSVYTMLGHQLLFHGEHFFKFFVFYVASLAIFPLAGWSVFSRRSSGTYALPAAGAIVLAMASLYYFRDGLNLGSARVPLLAAELAGLIPGQRLLLPLSVIACLPAARFLSSWSLTWNAVPTRNVKIGALCAFVVGFASLSICHQAYLRSFAKIQEALRENVPPDALVAVDGDTAKEFAPLDVVYRHVSIIDQGDAPPTEAYFTTLLFPGQSPPEKWTENRPFREIPIRSWVWNRDLLIVRPSGSKD